MSLSNSVLGEPSLTMYLRIGTFACATADLRVGSLERLIGNVWNPLYNLSASYTRTRIRHVYAPALEGLGDDDIASSD